MTERPEVVFAATFEPSSFPRDVLLARPSVARLSIAFVGVDLVVPRDDARLMVTNASGVAAEEVVQYVLAAIVGMSQCFPLFARRRTEG